MGKWETVKWIARYRTKEVLIFIIIMLIFILLSLMVSYKPGEGWIITPAAEVKINVKN